MLLGINEHSPKFMAQSPEMKQRQVHAIDALAERLAQANMRAKCRSWCTTRRSKR